MCSKEQNVPAAPENVEASDDEWVEAPVELRTNLKQNTSESSKTEVSDEFEAFLGSKLVETKSRDILLDFMNKELNKKIFSDSDFLKGIALQKEASQSLGRPWKERMHSRIEEASKRVTLATSSYDETLHGLTRPEIQVPTVYQEISTPGSTQQPTIYDSLNKMRKEEKLVTSRDMNAPFVRMSQKTFSAIGKIDPLSARFSKGGKRSIPSEKTTIERLKKARQLNIEDCIYCNLSDSFEAQHVLFKNDELMLILPYTRCLCPTQFTIVPVRHFSDSISLDADASRAVQVFVSHIVEYVSRY